MTDEGPMAKGSSPELLVELLAELDREVAPHVGSLRAQPGTSADEVRRSIGQFGLEAPDELVVLYGWHDGITPKRKSPYPDFGITSLRVSCIGYDTRHTGFLRDSPTAEDIDAITWGGGPGWFPLYPAQYTIVVDCNGPADVSPRVRFTDIEFEDKQFPRISGQAVSLCTVITWRIEGIRSGVYTWNTQNGEWDTDWNYMTPAQRASSL